MVLRELKLKKFGLVISTNQKDDKGFIAVGKLTSLSL